MLAILLVESDARTYAEHLERADRARISTASYVELINVCDRRVGIDAVAAADRLIERAEIELIPFTIEQARWARHARLNFGVGRHPANLNFGDCFAYALVKATGEPLLFKGNDFARTDIASAI